MVRLLMGEHLVDLKLQYIRKSQTRKNLRISAKLRAEIWSRREKDRKNSIKVILMRKYQLAKTVSL